MQIAGAIGSHVFYSTLFNPMPQSMVQHKSLPIMRRLWSPWVSFLLFLDRAIELTLFVEIYRYRAQENRDLYQSTQPYLGSYSLLARISIFVVLVIMDRLLCRFLCIIAPELKADNDCIARILRIDFIALRLAFFIVFSVWQRMLETVCASSDFKGSVVLWLTVRSWYADIDIF